ncbi:MAG TPA: TIGR01777 family oxidoreductase [Thermoleophilaceae bacterium]
MKVAATGASGTIGSALVEELRSRGDEVTVLSRRSEWPDPKDAPPPADTLRGRDAVVHLAGEPLAQRWTDDSKREIRDSRVLGTRNLVAALRDLPEGERPSVLVSQSAVGYYGAHGDEEVDESAAAGDDFLAQVVAEWEAEALEASELGVRVVTPRTGVVLSSGGGALEKMLPPFKLGVGGPVAGGRQYVPWVHLDDVAGAMVFLLDRPDASGPVNLTAPSPVTNGELSKTLGRVLRRPAVAPVPGFAVKLLYGEMAMVVTTGQRAVPKRLEELGYEFRKPDLEDALRSALDT